MSEQLKKIKSENCKNRIKMDVHETADFPSLVQEL